MNEYRVLLVDDEPLAVEAVATLMESIAGYSFDIYRAYNAKDALRILDEGRMDLVISDIEMSGCNGIELLNEIKRRWSDCPVTFLTAHSDFNYAYQAIRYGAANYILKTENDETFKLEIIKILEKISAEARLNTDLLAAEAVSVVEERHLSDIFQLNNIREVQLRLEKSGFSAEKAYCLLLCSYSEKDKRTKAMRELFQYHLQKKYSHMLSMVTADGDLVWLVQLDSKDKRELPQLFGLLETVQRSCEATLHVPIAIVMNPFLSDEILPSEVYAKTIESRNRIWNGRESVLFSGSMDDSPLGTDGAGNTVDWICNYIREHITGDTSLLKLSTLTGYNAQYLSGIFHQITGKTISRYVAEFRMKAVYRLLKDPSIPIQEAARQLGFSSRSYFNRFVKQETGMTPQQLRSELLSEN